MNKNFKTNDRWLYVDDVRIPKEFGWDIVRTYDAFVEWINLYGMPARLSLDHDLSYEHYPFAENNPHPTIIPYETYKEKTGYDCAKYIVENDLPLRHWQCHSMNPIGKKNIEALLENYERVNNGQDPRFK